MNNKCKVEIEMENVAMTPKEIVNQLKRVVVRDRQIYPDKDDAVALDEDVMVRVISHSGGCSREFCGREGEGG